MRTKFVLWLAVCIVATSLGPCLMADDGEKKIDWFGSLRARPEYNDNLSDVATGRDDKVGYVSYRINLGLSVELDKNVSLLFDGQAVGLWGENEMPFASGPSQDATSAKFNFFQAYGEAKNINDSPFSLRIGRQKLVYADEWLLGDLDHFGGTSWDAMVGVIDGDFADVSFIWGKGAEMDVPEMFYDPEYEDTNGDWDLYAGWASMKLADAMTLDAGVIYSLDRRKPGEEFTPYTDKRWTATVNYHWGEGEGLFIDANAAMQWGRPMFIPDPESPEPKIDANAAEVTVGWVFEAAKARHQVHGRFARYSGDDPNTIDVEYFDPLAQDFHGRYGYLDLWHGFWGLDAFVGGSPGAQFIQLAFESRLASGLTLTGLYQDVSSAEAPSPTNTNRNLGDEYGFLFAYDYSEHASFEVGLAQLYPGEGLLQYGNSTVRRFYVNTLVRF